MDSNRQIRQDCDYIKTTKNLVIVKHLEAIWLLYFLI